MATVNAQGFGPGATGASAVKIWRQQVAADGSGGWDVDYSSAGFSGIPIVVATAQNNTGTVTEQAWAHVNTASSTAASGTALRGADLAAFGDTVRTAPGVSVNVIAVGA